MSLRPVPRRPGTVISVQVAFAARLLGTHVFGRADRDSGGRYRVVAIAGVNAGDAEVRQQGVSIGEQDVLGFHIAVHEPRSMRVVEGRAHLFGDTERVLHGQLAVALDALAQRAAGEVCGYVVQQPARVAGVDERDQVRVRQARRDADLPQEPVGA